MKIKIGEKKGNVIPDDFFDIYMFFVQGVVSIYCVEKGYNKSMNKADNCQRL
jgi:hypothetical protein